MGDFCPHVFRLIVILAFIINQLVLKTLYKLSKPSKKMLRIKKKTF